MSIIDTRKKADEALSRVIQPVQLERKSTFQFRCHPGVPCFTRCCRNMDIILTPYDIIRIKRRLGLTSDLFLALYTQAEMLAEARVPVVRLKMLEEEDGRCPFVSAEGCRIYTDRPVCCRYYPIGMASLIQKEKKGGEEEEFFFLVKEDHCKGFDEQTVWTVDGWRADQEADLYDSMNRGWMELILRKKSFGEHTEMPEKARALFFMVTTNMEKFRSYVFESRFLDTYDVQEETLKKILEDDAELMTFGFEYLKSAVFGAETPVLSIKKEVLEREVKRIRKARKQPQQLPKIKPRGA
ncbi:MAG: YkgJ family cysteine cluster protein [Deltaproteobacteria bacterium]